MDILETIKLATNPIVGRYKLRMSNKRSAKIALAYFINQSIDKCSISALNIYLDAWLKMTNGKAYPSE